MLHTEALASWSECCARLNIQWYLYGDALLCARGYGTFPENLKCPQVAVYAADMERIVTGVFPALPGEWHLDIHRFAVKKGAICFQSGDRDILEIHTLYPAETPEAAAAYSNAINRLRADTRIRLKLLKLLGRVTGRSLESWIQRKAQKIVGKTFHRLLSLGAPGLPGAPLYCDHCTNKAGTLLPRELLEETEMLACGDGTYPVFSGYRTYLENVYYDYEKGLFDEIGCGLTQQDKEELKTHQARCREALAFVQQLSEEFNLRYYLLAGSVLGCVRHQGFIPWDDDIDLGIRMEDLARFEEVVKEQLPRRLPEGFRLMQCGPRNGYPRMFSKICYDGRCCIDLWPLVPTYTRGIRARLTWYFAKIITKVHYKKLGQELKRFVRIVNVMSLFMTDRMALWLARTNERMHSKGKFTAYVNLYSIYSRDKETIPRQWLDTEATGNFDGLTVPVVGCTEEYLTHLYGDYTAFPAPWKRASRHVDRFF